MKTAAQRLLDGKCAIVTGASAGLGLEIARKFIAAGASLMICARDEARLAEAQQTLQKLAGSGQSVCATAADVSQPGDVTRLVDDAVGRFGRIDILVSNAGIYGAKGAVDETDWNEWLRTIEINLLGPVLLCRAVLPHFKRARAGKIIQLSGGGASGPLPMLSAYAVSKAAVVRFVETLAAEVREHGIDVNAIAPGALNTGMLDEVLAAGPGKIGLELYERSLQQRNSGGTSPEKGADLAVFLGSSLSNGISGKLLSAVWDPWDTLPEHLSDLQGKDVYTLRRIVPDDRGLAWGKKE